LGDSARSALANISATQGASLGDRRRPLGDATAGAARHLGDGGHGDEPGVPSLKPMLEASIRRVTVKVDVEGGTSARDLEVTHF